MTQSVLLAWHGRRPAAASRCLCHLQCSLTPSQAYSPEFTLTSTPGHPFQHTVADLDQLDGQVSKCTLYTLTGFTGELELAHFPSGSYKRQVVISNSIGIFRGGVHQGRSLQMTGRISPAMQRVDFSGGGCGWREESRPSTSRCYEAA